MVPPGEGLKYRKSNLSTILKFSENYEKIEKRLETDGTSPSSAEKRIPHAISILIRPTRPPDDVKIDENHQKTSEKSYGSVQKIMFFSRIRPENHVFQPNLSRNHTFRGSNLSRKLRLEKCFLDHI